MRTVGQHILLMQHALGKSPATGHDLYHTFRDAGQQLMALEWSWAKRGPVQLPFVSGQDFFDLPPDFGRVVSVYSPNGPTQSVRQVTAQEMAQLRGGGGVGVTGLYVAVCFDSARGQRNPGEGSRVVGEVWPTPTANDTPDVRLVYTRSFPLFTSADEDVKPDIDPAADLLLTFMAQDLAFLMENKRRVFEPDVIDNEITRLRRLDGSRQWDSGQMSGGALDRLPPTGQTVPIDTITVT